MQRRRHKRRRRKQTVSQQRRSLLIRASGIVALLVAIPVLVNMLSRAGDAIGWGQRIDAVERSTKELSQGQADLARRIEVMGLDVGSLRRELIQSSDRSDRGFQAIMTELAGIKGGLASMVEQSIKTQEQLAGVKEKAANALVATDAIREQLNQHQIEQAKEAAKHTDK